MPTGRHRFSRDGRLLRREDILKPAAYRPEAKGRGLHAIVEAIAPFRDGKAVPLEGPLDGATVLLLWFRVDDRPIEGSPVWDRSAQVIAPALAIALRNLAVDAHLVVEVQPDRGETKPLVDPRNLEKFLGEHFERGFRGYIGDDPSARRAPGINTVRGFATGRARDLKDWLIVTEESYHAGALEIWSRTYSADDLAARLNLATINAALSRVHLARFTRQPSPPDETKRTTDETSETAPKAAKMPRPKRQSKNRGNEPYNPMNAAYGDSAFPPFPKPD